MTTQRAEQVGGDANNNVGVYRKAFFFYLFSFFKQMNFDSAAKTAQSVSEGKTSISGTRMAVPNHSRGVLPPPPCEVLRGKMTDGR